MEEVLHQGDLLVKCILKCGQVIALYTDQSALDEMTSHPKYIRMHDKKNTVFLSIEDISGFECLNFRQPDDAPIPVAVPAQPATATPVNNGIQEAV